ERAALAELPKLAEQALAEPAPVDLAARYRFAARLVTTGRGYAYPTAREAALKLMETSYLPALAFSGADLLHGPLAMTDPAVPVLAGVGDVAGAAGRLSVPAVTDERYSPLLDILPLQNLALALALARGEDPDAPRGLKKVTTTL